MESNIIVTKKKKRINSKSSGEKIVYGFVFCFFSVYTVILLFPYVWGLVSSFKTPLEYYNAFDLPKKLLFSNYKTAVESMAVEGITMLDMLWNSIWFTFGSVIISLECISLTGYTLSKYRVRGRGIIMAIIMIPMIIPVYGTFPAMYNFYYESGLVDSYLILITAIGALGFNTLIMMSFYDNISWTYAEAGMIDGAGNLTIYFKLMRPQAAPMYVTLFLLSFIGKWNDYMSALLYLPNMLTLATGLYKYQEVAERQGNYPIYFAASFMFITPCVVLYSIFSKTMMENLSIGAIK